MAAIMEEYTPTEEARFVDSWLLHQCFGMVKLPSISSQIQRI